MRYHSILYVWATLVASQDGPDEGRIKPAIPDCTGTPVLDNQPHTRHLYLGDMSIIDNHVNIRLQDNLNTLMTNATTIETLFLSNNFTSAAKQAIELARAQYQLQRELFNAYIHQLTAPTSSPRPTRAIFGILSHVTEILTGTPSELSYHTLIDRVNSIEKTRLIDAQYSTEHELWVNQTFHHASNAMDQLFLLSRQLYDDITELRLHTTRAELTHFLLQAYLFLTVIFERYNHLLFDTRGETIHHLVTLYPDIIPRIHALRQLNNSEIYADQIMHLLRLVRPVVQFSNQLLTITLRIPLLGTKMETYLVQNLPEHHSNGIYSLRNSPTNLIIHVNGATYSWTYDQLQIYCIPYKEQKFACHPITERLFLINTTTPSLGLFKLTAPTFINLSPADQFLLLNPHNQPLNISAVCGTARFDNYITNTSTIIHCSDSCYLSIPTLPTVQPRYIGHSKLIVINAASSPLPPLQLGDNDLPNINTINPQFLYTLQALNALQTGLSEIPHRKTPLQPPPLYSLQFFSNNSNYLTMGFCAITFLILVCLIRRRKT